MRELRFRNSVIEYNRPLTQSLTFDQVLTEETSALNSGAEAKLMADAAAALSAAAAATSGAQPQGDYTFDDLKQRLTTDMDIKFNSSAWFGGWVLFDAMCNLCVEMHEVEAYVTQCV